MRFEKRKVWPFHIDQINMEANTPYNNSLTSHYAYTHILGQKRYELPDHLGNVMATISDMRQSMADSGGFNRVIKYYKSVDKSVSDYYPFGMLMPGRNKENGKGFIMHATSITNIPAHNYTGLSLPTGGEVLFGPIVSVSTSTTYNIATAAGGGVAYILDPMYAGVSHTYKVIVSTMTMGASFQAELYDAMGTSIVTIPLYIGANNITFTPPTYDAVTMKIVSTAAGTHTIKLSSLAKDSISFLPQMSTNIISNGGEYQYGFNGQMKVNEWAGKGSHTTALFWEYDTRTARRGNLDPKPSAWQSSYSVLNCNPIRFNDILGDSTFRFDKNGIFQGIGDLEQKGLRGSIGQNYTVTNSNGEQVTNWVGDEYFDFNDPDLDRGQLVKMKIGDRGLMIVSDENMNYIMQIAGIKPMWIGARLDYAMQESNGGFMDFNWNYLLPLAGLTSNASEGGDVKQFDQKGGFVIFGGNNVAYNLNDGGQFLWGNAMCRLGFSYSSSKIGSQANEFFGDSDADQRAINWGFNYIISSKKINPGVFVDLNLQLLGRKRRR